LPGRPWPARTSTSSMGRSGPGAGRLLRIPPRRLLHVNHHFLACRPSTSSRCAPARRGVVEPVWQLCLRALRRQSDFSDGDAGGDGADGRAVLTGSTATFQWTAVSGNPALSFLKYEVVVKNLGDGTTELQTSELSPSLSTVYSLGSGNYEVKVRACQAGCGPWSGRWVSRWTCRRCLGRRLWSRDAR